MDGSSNTPVRVDVGERSEMMITADDAQLLRGLLSAYRMARSLGKWAVYALVSLLGFIVLASQAWNAVKGVFIKH